MRCGGRAPAALFDERRRDGAVGCATSEGADRRARARARARWRPQTATYGWGGQGILLDGVKMQRKRECECAGRRSWEGQVGVEGVG